MSKEYRKYRKALSLDVPFSDIDLTERDAANVANEEPATPGRTNQQMSSTPKSKRLIVVHSSPSPPRMTELTPVTLLAPVKMRKHFQRISGNKENKENRKGKDKFVQSNNTTKEKQDSRENGSVVKDKLKYSVDHEERKVRIALTHLRI
ncbi:uncharacterized protein LOC112495066 [Cephus cinctus]|uniref:Uncharacterized protein LOC112495066 n=1 Tax=Cephus cinctus TaxID=211228 RepID=A0AAJ7W5T7_CEPCN|nr:uncharacterized protein LOC112495066 [Cephus cinctus]